MAYQLTTNNIMDGVHRIRIHIILLENGMSVLCAEFLNHRYFLGARASPFSGRRKSSGTRINWTIRIPLASSARPPGTFTFTTSALVVNIVRPIYSRLAVPSDEHEIVQGSAMQKNDSSCSCWDAVCVWHHYNNAELLNTIVVNTRTNEDDELNSCWPS